MLKSIIKKKEEGGIFTIEVLNLSQSNHPIACIFHFIFKGFAILFHFVLGWFIADFEAHEIVIILSAFDFWTVKNITGRYYIFLD